MFMAGFQYDFLETKDETLKRNLHHESQLSMLPASPLQFQLDNEDPTLSKRELEIMHMVLTGYTINEIALKVFISVHGIKFRLGSIYWKFNVSSRLGLIKKASLNGLQFLTESGTKQIFHLEFKSKDNQLENKQHDENAD